MKRDDAYNDDSTTPPAADDVAAGNDAATPPAGEDERATDRRSKRMAALATVVLALFCVVVIAGMTLLDRAAPQPNTVYQNGKVLQTEQPFYVLLIGSDSRVGTALYTGKSGDHAQLDQHSDIMTLVRVDPRTYTLTLVTVPRDTWYNGAKLNDTLLDGDAERTVTAIEDLCGVYVDYWVMTDFIGYETIVDALGGVNVDVPMTVTVPDPATADDLTIKAGDDVLLDGPQALVLARSRKSYGENQEALRQINVRDLEAAMISKVVAGEVDPETAVESLRDNTTSDMDWGLVKALIQRFTAHGTVTVYSCSGPYAGSDDNPSKLWIIDRNDATWHALMSVVDAGGDPSDIVPLPDFPLTAQAGK